VRPPRRAPRALERRPEGARDGLEHEAVGYAGAQLAHHDPLNRLPLIGRCSFREGAQQLGARPARARAGRLGDVGERRRDVREAQRRPRARRRVVDRRQPADPEHARVRLRKCPPGQERDGGGHCIGRQRPQVVREQRELVEAARARAQPPAEIREPGELDHSENHYKYS